MCSARNALQNVASAFLDAHPLEPENDRLQVGIEAVWRDRNDPFIQRIVEKRHLAAEVVILDDRLIVDIFGRHIHQGEIEGALIRADVLRGDGVDMRAHVADERLALRPCVLPRPGR